MRLSLVTFLVVLCFQANAASGEVKKPSESWIGSLMSSFSIGEGAKSKEAPKKSLDKATVAERNNVERDSDRRQKKNIQKNKGKQLDRAREIMAEKSEPPKTWITYYTSKASVDDFDPYDLLVLDSSEHPPLIPLKQKGKMLLGYISLGEVEKYRPHFKEVQAQGLLSEMNPNWPGSYYVDIRDPRWFKRVVEELVPGIINQGFDGIFMDTLDNPEFLEEENPKKYKGMKKAAIRLVKAIRQHFPNIKIMMNRGFELLPELVHTIDMEMGEVTYTQYDFKRKKYLMQPAEEHKYYVDILKNAKRRNPKLLIYTLDYWYKNQKNVIKNIYKKQRAYGFYPYVATIKLNEIIPEPGRRHAKASG